MGAGSPPHGGAPADRGGVRVYGRGGPATPRVGSGSAARDRARRNHRRARGTLQQQPPGETDQPGRHPSPAGTLRAVALRLPQRRRGGQAAGARGAGRRDHGPGRADRAGGAARGVRVTLELQLFLLVWGTLVGLDLVSVPQMMIARPIVAGPVAGAILGDLATGLQLGVLFELFQYDVMPMGASRYPEYGPPTVAPPSTAHAAAGAPGLGLGRLEAGDVRLLVRLHVTAIARDALRAAVVTAAGLALAHVVRLYFGGALPLRGVTLLGVAAVAGAIATATAGTLRVVGRGANLRWFAAGLAGGAVLVGLR